MASRFLLSIIQEIVQKKNKNETTIINWHLNC